MNLKPLLLGSALTILSAAGASAGTVYATVVDYDQGTVPSNFSNSLRGNPNHAKGAADGKFLSLGFGGTAVFSFGVHFGGGGDGSIVEMTFERANYPENADIYIGTSYTLGSFDLDSFTLLTSVTNQTVGGVTTFSIPGVYTYLAVVDTTDIDDDISGLDNNGDGFDIDAISVSAVPVPAAGILLLGALGGLGLMRRRKNA